MRKEDREIKYRPSLAEILQNDLNFMKSYYSKNFPQMYYKVLSILYGSEKNEKGEKLFDMVAGWYEHPYEVLEMFSEYRRELAEFDVYEPISDARAFCILNEIYDKEFKARKDLVDRKAVVHWRLTKASKVTFTYDAIAKIQYNADEQSAIEKFTMFHSLKSKITVKIPEIA